MSVYTDVAQQVKDVVQASGAEKKWVVFDIDETLLTPRSSGNVFAQQWRGAMRGIEEMVELHNELVLQGVRTALITGRKENMRDITKSTLANAGVKGYSRLYMKALGKRVDNVEYKTGARKHLSESGTIVANIGDQETDLAGGYAEHTFKLPSSY